MNNQILSALDRGKSIGKISPKATVLDALSHVLLERPDMIWRNGRPTQARIDRRHEDRPMLNFSGDRIVANDQGMGGAQDLDIVGSKIILESTSEAISIVAEQLFAGLSIDRFAYLSPGVLFARVPYATSAFDQLLYLSMFRHLARHEAKVVAAPSFNGTTPFNLDEFEFSMILMLCVQMDEEKVAFEDLADRVTQSLC